MPWELYEPMALPSYSLLSRLALAFPAVDFSLVIGADLVPTLTSWKHAAQLLREIHFLVLARPGYDLRAALEKQPADTLPATFHIVEEASDDGLGASDISSTLLRTRLMPAGCIDEPRYRDIEGLTPLSVISYIAAQRLYTEMVATPAATPITSAAASPARSPVSSWRRSAPAASTSGADAATTALSRLLGRRGASPRRPVATSAAAAAPAADASVPHVFAALPLSSARL